MLVRTFVLICAIYITACSDNSNSTENGANNLIGTWVGNCVHVSGGEIEPAFYSIRTLSIDNTTTVVSGQYFTDPNCRDPIDTDIGDGVSTYSIGEETISSDGLPVTEITITTENDSPERFSVLEAVYRINGDQLVFGYYSSDLVPELLHNHWFHRNLLTLIRLKIMLDHSPNSHYSHFHSNQSKRYQYQDMNSPNQHPS